MDSPSLCGRRCASRTEEGEDQATIISPCVRLPAVVLPLVLVEAPIQGCGHCYRVLSWFVTLATAYA